MKFGILILDLEDKRLEMVRLLEKTHRDEMERLPKRYIYDNNPMDGTNRVFKT